MQNLQDTLCEQWKETREVKQAEADVSVSRRLCALQWENLTVNSADSTPFHSGSWIEVLSRTFGCRPLFVIARDQADTLLAGMPIIESRSCMGLLKEYHSLFWGSYGSAIVRNGTGP